MINDFKGEFSYLSNFHLAPVKFANVLYPSVEHAFQAAKTHDTKARQKLLSMTCVKVKKAGKKLSLRSDWEEVKKSIMLDLVRQKFTKHSELGTALKNTASHPEGSQTLIEGNTWHDNFWGSCICMRCGYRGKNELGKILMQVRSELLEASK